MGWGAGRPRPGAARECPWRLAGRMGFRGIQSHKLRHLFPEEPSQETSMEVLVTDRKAAGSPRARLTAEVTTGHTAPWLAQKQLPSLHPDLTPGSRGACLGSCGVWSPIALPKGHQGSGELCGDKKPPLQHSLPGPRRLGLQCPGTL